MELATRQLALNNLRERLASFIGREKELAAIRDLLKQHRLVMLTGTGGIGKTNLCLQTGHDLLANFSDGVWLIEQAPPASTRSDPQVRSLHFSQKSGFGSLAPKSLTRADRA